MYYIYIYGKRVSVLGFGVIGLGGRNGCLSGLVFGVLEKNVETKWKLGMKSVYTKDVEACVIPEVYWRDPVLYFTRNLGPQFW